MKGSVCPEGELAEPESGASRRLEEAKLKTKQPPTDAAGKSATSSCCLQLIRIVGVCQLLPHTHSSGLLWSSRKGKFPVNVAIYNPGL